MMEYHEPVMAKEAIDYLNIKADGSYADATFGGGGHSALILKQLGDKGRLISFDQDEDALQNVAEDQRFTFVQNNFRFLKRFLRLHGLPKLDGILADLGVSSHQLEIATRGFSFRFEGPLDMRMNQEADQTAADIVNQYSAEQLQLVFSRYGEVRNARTLAEQIVQSRQQRKISTIGDFVQLLDPLIRGPRQRYLAQVFQALRIEVNEEMEALKDLLKQSLEVLNPGGRIVIISYHSIEDRIVKNFLKTGNFDGTPEKDFYGNIYRPFKIITKKAILPSNEEVKRNPRARSAKLRTAELLSVEPKA